MLGSLRGRIIVILAVAALSLYSLLENGVRPGLDLRGGMYLALEIDDPDETMTPEAKADAIDQNLTVLRNRIDQFGVSEPDITKAGNDRIIVQLPGIEDEERAKGIIESQAFLEWKPVNPTSELTVALQRMDRLIAEQIGMEPDTGTAADTTSARPRAQGVEALLFGDTATADTTQGDTVSDTLNVVQPPSANPLTSLLVSGGEGELWVPQQDVDRVRDYLELPGVIELLPRRTELVWAADTTSSGAQLYRPLYFLGTEAVVTGDRLEDAQAGRDPQFNETIVSFTLDRQGGRAFSEYTGAHIGDRVAIVLDGLVHSAPVLQSQIGQRGQIELGQAPLSEANDLALVLRAGALPAPLTIMEQRSVGPSLGRDSIEQGKIAGIIGIVLVVLIMMLYYRLAGVLAVVALALYVLFVLGGLAGLGAALSAPGIAGLILSLGMAVDANVLIFERIREELIAGKSTRAAVDAGFQHAMSAIVDSNLTTLITALVLYQIGTGPVRGFAVTLSIGIVASFFSAVYVTRTFFLLYLERKKASDPISI